MRSIPFVIHGFLCGLCLIPILIFGCGLFDHEKNKFVIIVGSKHITTDELEKDMAFIGSDIDVPDRHLPQIRARLIEKIIDHYLIMEYGKEKGITVSENELQSVVKELREEYTEDGFKEALLRGYVDFEQWKKRLREQFLVNRIIKKVTESIVPPDYQEIKQYFEEHQNEFRSPQALKFRQIVTRTKGEAENIIELLNKGDEMGNLAKKHSIAPEAENGGEVGWVDRGQLDASMDMALFSMQQGEISPVIQTPYGYHVFEVLSVRPAGRRELPEAIFEIESKLFSKRRELFFKDWLMELRAHFEVKINHELL